MEALRWALPLKLTGPKKAVLVVLANAANDSAKCWPSISLLALHSGFKGRAVQIALGQLAGIGVLTVERSMGRVASHYTLNLKFDNGMIPPSEGSPTVHKVHRNGELRAGLNGEHSLPTPHEVQRSTPHDMHRNPAPHAPTPHDMHPNPKEPSKNPKRSTPKPPHGGLGSESDLDFVTFWDCYPKKEGLGRARKAWVRALTKAPAATIIAGVRRYPFDPSPRWRQLACNWLDDEAWLQAGADDGFDPVLRAVGITPEDFAKFGPEAWGKMQ